MDQLPALAAELGRPPGDCDRRVQQRRRGRGKTATTTIPIVFLIGDDPIRAGLVTSLARPSGNVTGVTFASTVLGPKRLQLLRSLASQCRVDRLAPGPEQPGKREPGDGRSGRGARARAATDDLARRHQRARSKLGLCAPGAAARRRAVRQRQSVAFASRRDQIAALAARHKVPTMYNFREYAAAGGLISYGASILDTHRQSGLYVGRILRGSRPSDLPVLQPTQFELVLNLKTAKALGLEFPATLLALADEVGDRMSVSACRLGVSRIPGVRIRTHITTFRASHPAVRRPWNEDCRQRPTPSCPRLSRASTSFPVGAKQGVDGRDKPGHDEIGLSP